MENVLEVVLMKSLLKVENRFFYVFLTVHLSIILTTDQLCAPDGHLQSVTIPDAVQYNLTSDDEHNSARNIQRNIINLL